MEILIRKIQRKGDSFIFKPNSRGGYRLTEELAQPQLTPFQISCISTESKKDRKSRVFWTPDYCYIGLCFSNEYELDINKLLHSSGDSGDESMLHSFNRHFPDKKCYWYTKPDSQDFIVQVYFLGVRLVSSIIYHYFKLVTLGRLKEAKELYNSVIKPIGLKNIVAQADSKLIGKGDNLHTIACEDGNYFIRISKKEQNELKDSYYESNSNTSKRVSSTPKTQSDRPRDAENEKELGEQAEHDSGLLKRNIGSNKPTLADIRLPKIFSDEAEDDYNEDYQSKTKPTQPVKLPKIGDS